MFADAAAAVRWGAANLGPEVREPSLAAREAGWLLEAAAVAAGRDPLFIRQPEISSRVQATFRSYVARRARGEPLAYVMGEANFRGLDLVVTSDVLIPRPETEQLVEIVQERLPRAAKLSILDQGTGSGAIAVSLAVERPDWRVTAVDLSESALEIAQRNAVRHGVGDRIEFLRVDLAPGQRRFDVIVANLPYVPDGADLPTGVKDWEPAGALRGGPTGREVIERSIEMSDDILLDGGWLFYEIGEEQQAGFEAKFPGRFEFRYDLAGRLRFMIGRRG